MTPEPAATSFVEKFKACRLLILGDVMLDEYLWGSVRRICPEAPVPIVEEIRRSSVPGGMANVAVNAAALGAHVAVAGIVGPDAQGDILRNMLKPLGIDADGIRTDPKRRTTLKTRIIAHDQQVVRLDREDTHPISSGLEEGVLKWFVDRLPDAHCCVLSDYAKGVLSPALTSEIIAAATRSGLPVVVDPKGREYHKYRGASIITPNLDEARMALANGGHPPTDLSAIGAGLLEILPGTAALVTRGPEGVALFRSARPPLYIPSAARQVYDVTGAGDTLVATLALALAAGCPVELAATLANGAAGIAVEKVGTATVTASELQASVEVAGRNSSVRKYRAPFRSSAPRARIHSLAAPIVDRRLTS